MQKPTITMLAVMGLVAGALVATTSAEGKANQSEDTIRAEHEPKRCGCDKRVPKPELGLHAHAPA